MSTKKDCHIGPTIVLQIDNIELCGASLQEAKEKFYKFDLVISLEKLEPPTKKLSGKLRSASMLALVNKYSSKTEHLCIRWPDMGVPSLTKAFWIDLVEAIRKNAKKSTKTI
jgi:hypothetical protein